MPSIYTTAYQWYSQVYHELADHRTDDWFLMGSPWTEVMIVIAYYYFVSNLGPRLMKDRPPFNVDRVVSAYNLMQVAVCAFLFAWSFYLGFGTRYSISCEPIDYTRDHHTMRVLKGIYWYHLVKVLDLCDTVFFVLRKKQHQITFLHVYHHSVMVLGSWFVVKFLPGGQSALLGVLNCLVHVVMYSYYFVTSNWPQYKNNLWWKKHITQLQLMQFFVDGVHMFSTFFVKDCDFPKIPAAVIGIQAIFMTALFFDFYRRAYGGKKRSA